MPDTPHAVCCWCQRALVKSAGTGTWWCPTETCQQRQLRWSVTVEHKKTKALRYLYVPLPKLVNLYECPATNILLGGAAGPGKSTGGRYGAYRKCFEIEGFEALILRETFPELERTHLRRMADEAAIFTAAGVEVEFVESRRLMRFPKGSLIECGHMEDEQAVKRYLSAEYDLIVADEGSQYQPDALLELSTRARTSKPAVLAAGGARFWVVSNPGGPSASMLLDFFIDHQPDFDKYPALEAEYQPEDWVYIPATLDDNPYIDPAYVSKLARLSKWRYEQLRHGDWRVFAGQFFPEFNERTHVREVTFA